MFCLWYFNSFYIVSWIFSYRTPWSLGFLFLFYFLFWGVKPMYAKQTLYRGSTCPNYPNYWAAFNTILICLWIQVPLFLLDANTIPGRGLWIKEPKTDVLRTKATTICPSQGVMGERKRARERPPSPILPCLFYCSLAAGGGGEPALRVWEQESWPALP